MLTDPVPLHAPDPLRPSTERSSGPRTAVASGGVAKPILAGMLIGLQDVDLASVGGGVIRVFDVVSLVVVGLGLRTLLRRSLDGAHLLYLLWCAVGVLAVLNGAIVFELPLFAGLLFAARPVQYLLVGLALSGAIADRRAWLLFAGTAFALITVSVGFDVVDASLGGGPIDRIGSSYGGPFELACVAGGLAFASLRDHRLFGLASLLFLAVFFSASRITVAVVILLAVWLVVRSLIRRPQLLLGAAALTLAAAAVLPILGGAGIFATTTSRFAKTGLTDEIEVSAEVAAGLTPPATQAEVERATILDVKRALPVDPELDRSAMLRFTRWRLLLDRQNDELSSTVLGLGPGAGSQAVDGYYVRLLVETGVIGLAVYLAFLVAMARVGWRWDRTLLLYLVVLAVSAVFVDVLVAAKAMTLLWILAGNRS